MISVYFKHIFLDIALLQSYIKTEIKRNGEDQLGQPDCPLEFSIGLFPTVYNNNFIE